MDNQKTDQRLPMKKKRFALALILAAILLAGIILIRWTVLKTGEEMRAGLLEQARTAAQSLNIESLAALTGTGADLKSPDYLQLKNRLMGLHANNPQSRFIYLLARRADGEVIILADSEPADSKDYSPPGQIYEDIPESYRRVFDAKTEFVEGPITDRWGTWVSALIPIKNTATDASGLVTQSDAQAMVRKAIDFYRKNGRDRFLQEINNPRGEFVKGDLYIFAYDRNMTMKAHPMKPELVGQNLLNEKDWSGGKYFRREIQKVALTRGSGWVDYTYENPVNKKITAKTTYLELADNLIICAGAYKEPEELLALLGMDIDARSWTWNMVSGAALPVGMMLFFVIVVALIFFYNQPGDIAPKPIMRRLMPPLVVSILVLIAGFIVFTWQQYQQKLNNKTLAQLSEVSRLVQVSLDQQVNGLTTALHPVTSNPDLQKALREGDAAHLLAAWRPVFEKMKQQEKISHFNFISADRVLLLRLHKPEKHGDRIDRFTLLEAQRTGRTASGIEAGLVGAFTLRVVQPVLAGGRIAGYVELGKEIDLLMQSLQIPSGNHLAVTIKKEGSSRQAYEEGMRLMGRESDWNRLSNRLLIYTSLRPFPDTLASWIEKTTGKNAPTQKEQKITFDGREWFAAVKPFQDASGKTIGDLLIIHDLSQEHAAFSRMIVLGGTGVVLLLTTLLGFLYILIRRTDLGIKAQQEDLRNKEERYRLLVENINETMLVIQDGRIKYANIHAAASFGYSAEDIKNINIFELIHPDDREEVQKRYIQKIQGDTTPTLHTHRTLTKSGEIRWVELSSVRIDWEGRPATLNLISDITDRKQAEEALRESESLQRTLLVNLPAGVIIVDPVTRVIEQVNEHVADLFGGSVDHLLGHRCHTLLCPANEGACPVCDLGQPVDNSDREMLRMDGSRLPILKTVKRIRLNGQEKLLECFVDVSARREAEEKLKDREARYKYLSNQLETILDNIPGLVFYKDTKNNYIRVNQYIASMHGKTKEELEGKSMFDLYPREDAERYYSDDLAVINSGVPKLNFEERWQTNGKFKWLLTSKIPFVDETGKISGILGFSFDITQRKEAEMAMKERFKELNCLYNISALIASKDLNLEEIFIQAVLLIPPALQFVEIAEARITLEEQSYPTPRFRETPWMLAHEIILNGRTIGKVEACYREEPPAGKAEPFMPEEQKLFTAIAERLGRFVERKRAEEQIRLNTTRLTALLNIMQYRSTTTQEFLDYSLHEVIRLTESKIGYIYFYHEDRREFVLNTYSKDVMQECTIENPQTCYELDKTGVWGEAVRQRKPIILNDFRAEHPLKKGYPEGHAPLTRFLTVPVFKDDAVIAVVGVANKAHDYDENDVLQLTLFMDAVWKSVEIKDNEERLRESESRIRAITDSAQDAILMMDNKGNISYWNPAAESILGYTREEALGKNLHELIVPEKYIPAHLAAFPAFQQTGTGNAVGKTLELAARRKDGREIDVALSLSAAKIRGDWSAVGILRDITERKLEEATLLETNRRLEEAIVEAKMANAAKSDFLANMSHEIRTPMNAIIGMADLLWDSYLTPDQRQYVQIFRSAGENLLALINDILDLSKVESGQLTLEKIPYDLFNLIEKTNEVLAVRANNRKLELACRIAPDVPRRVQGDPTRLRQVLMNLLGNAVKFTEKGEILLTVEPFAGDAPKGTNKFLQFSVRDTGIGIPAEKLDTIFEKFTQSDASITRKYEGSGLGLAISKQIIELTGGKIWVESRLGEGSTFIFTLPLEEAPPEKDDKTVFGPEADLRGVNILIVDDNATNRLILRETLSQWGCVVTEAAGGAEGLAALKKAKKEKTPFRVAILDSQMPEMDGITLARKIRGKNEFAAMSILMLTSERRSSDRVQLKDIDIAGYLIKPVKRDVLKQALLAAVGREEILRKPQAPPDKILAEDSRPLRILLVEDSEDNRFLVQAYLKDTAYRIDMAENGQVAVEKFSSAVYDLIFMDMQMPVMDGYTATREIRRLEKKEKRKPTPIVALTAHALKGDMEKSLEAGCDTHLTKPIRKPVLLETIRKFAASGPAEKRKD